VTRLGLQTKHTPDNCTSLKARLDDALPASENATLDRIRRLFTPFIYQLAACSDRHKPPQIATATGHTLLREASVAAVITPRTTQSLLAVLAVLAML